jgi:hypothetical protein
LAVATYYCTRLEVWPDQVLISRDCNEIGKGETGDATEREVNGDGFRVQRRRALVLGTGDSCCVGG